MGGSPPFGWRFAEVAMEGEWGILLEPPLALETVGANRAVGSAKGVGRTGGVDGVVVAGAADDLVGRSTEFALSDDGIAPSSNSASPSTIL